MATQDRPPTLSPDRVLRREGDRRQPWFSPRTVVRGSSGRSTGAAARRFAKAIDASGMGQPTFPIPHELDTDGRRSECRAECCDRCTRSGTRSPGAEAARLETTLERADREATEREVDLEAILVRQLRELVAAVWLLVSRSVKPTADDGHATARPWKPAGTSARTKRGLDPK